MAEAGPWSYVIPRAVACAGAACAVIVLYAAVHISHAHSPVVIPKTSPSRQSGTQAGPHKPAPAMQTMEVAQSLEAGRAAPSYDDVAEKPAKPAVPPRVERFKLARPVSIMGLLRDAGLDEQQQDRWAEVFRSSAHWGILNPGHQVAVYKDPETGQMQALEYDLNEDSVLKEQTVGGGVVLASLEPLTYQPHTVGYSLSLGRGLDLEQAQQRVPTSVLERVKNAFGDRLQRVGATLKVIYKELSTPDGAHHRGEELQAAQLQCNGRRYSVFAFTDDQGREHLYDEHGKPTGPQFLRFPLDFKYISSTFSLSRYHPILHRFRAHVGVDLAANYGTPVSAASDGKVQFAGWDGELGRCVKIEHQDGMTSIYGHLAQISEMVKEGAVVRIGQVIGWVGSTGLATGPHLHYALYKDGHFLDPLTADIDEGTGGISDSRRRAFERVKRQYSEQFAQLPGVSRSGLEAVAEPEITIDDDGKAGTSEMKPAPRRGRRHRDHQTHLIRGGLLRDSEAHRNPSERLALSRFFSDLGGL